MDTSIIYDISHKSSFFNDDLMDKSAPNKLTKCKLLFAERYQDIVLNVISNSSN